MSLSNKTAPMDLVALPTNLCISPNLCATKILVDKPITNQATVTPISKPVKRFSSIRDNLTIDTSTPAPSQTLGLEVVTTKRLTGARCQLFCKNSVVFASDKHHLVRSLEATSTPSTSRGDGAVGRHTSLASAGDSTQWPKMVFSISMQHLRHMERPTTIQERLLASISCMVDRFSKSAAEEQSSQAQDRTIYFSSVVLHQSNRVVENGQVRPNLPDDDVSKTLGLEISATTLSLQSDSPIQIQVKVITQPVAQDAFGNTEMVRKGEAVLMEGLVLARQMAKAGGWTCLEEDDSQMVEWVRDQMSIQWDLESTTQASTLLPVCSGVDGLQTYTRSRTLSGGGFRVRTPNISPYASRTHSYHAKKRKDLGLGERRDSTLARLQQVSANLQAHKKREQGDENHLRVPTVAIAAAEGPSLQRPPLRTSFGGFSSLNDSRMQTLALAAKTEDHLGLALAMGSPPSPEERKQDKIGVFGEGIGPDDAQNNNNNNSNNNSKDQASPPEPRRISRFSIKSYQLERSNHGLSGEWGIGSLDANFGKITATNDLLSTPPLITDVGLPGTVSPLTPSPEHVPTTDFLQGLNISNIVSQDSSTVDSGSRKSL
ncbi:hypothetical protein BGZ65_000878, partial [Modicella reniformis]